MIEPPELDCTWVQIYLIGHDAWVHRKTRIARLPYARWSTGGALFSSKGVSSTPAKTFKAGADKTPFDVEYDFAVFKDSFLIFLQALYHVELDKSIDLAMNFNR